MPRKDRRVAKRQLAGNVLAPEGAASSALPRLAIASLAMYSPDALSNAAAGTCPTSMLGMLGWCQGAQRMTDTLTGIANVTMLILTNQSSMVREICPGARVVAPDDTVAQLVQQWAATHGQEFDPPSEYGTDAFTLANMQKLQLLGQDDYDALLFTDGDILLLGAQDAAGSAAVTAARSLWAERLPSFLADAKAEILGAPDYSAPLNGGLWLVKPSHDAYDTAIGVLRRNVWNVTHGFDLVGPPASLLPSIYASCNQAPFLNMTRFVQDNNWHCVGCGTDQGMLFYIFHVLRGGGYRQAEGHREAMVQHWWAHPKPWEYVGKAELAERIEYFESLDLNERSAATPTAAACVRELRRLQALGVAGRQEMTAEQERRRPTLPNWQTIFFAPPREQLHAAAAHGRRGAVWRDM